MKMLIPFTLLLFSLQSFANVGVVSLLKGTALVGETPLKVEDVIHEGDVLKTNRNSILKVKFNDNTFITLGPESELKIKKYRNLEGKRDNHLRLIKGKLRSLVKKIATDGEKLRFDAKLVTLGVRGTEFITSVASVGGAPSTDTLLLKGSLQASGTGFNSFIMKPGEYFNSQDIMKMGRSAIKTLAKEALLKIKESPLDFSIGVSAVGAAASLIPSVPSVPVVPKLVEKEDEPEAETIPLPKEKKKKVMKAKTMAGFKYNLKSEPWDIRDAVMNRARYKSENKCFFYFYKKLPGSGEPERFRRERECDEFEYDL